MDKIATREFCNSINPGAFSSDLRKCPTYKDLIDSNKFMIRSQYQDNQLVREIDISKRITEIPTLYTVAIGNNNNIIQPIMYIETNTSVTNGSPTINLGVIGDWISAVEVSNNVHLRVCQNITSDIIVQNGNINCAVDGSDNPTTKDILVNEQFYNTLPRTNNAIIYLFDSDQINSDISFVTMVLRNPDDNSGTFSNYEDYFKKYSVRAQFSVDNISTINVYNQYGTLILEQTQEQYLGRELITDSNKKYVYGSIYKVDQNFSLNYPVAPLTSDPIGDLYYSGNQMFVTTGVGILNLDDFISKVSAEQIGGKMSLSFPISIGREIRLIVFLTIHKRGQGYYERVYLKGYADQEEISPEKVSTIDPINLDYNLNFTDPDIFIYGISIVVFSPEDPLSQIAQHDYTLPVFESNNYCFWTYWFCRNLRYTYKNTDEFELVSL